MILLISINKELLHYYEFVRPVEDILRGNDEDFTTRHYKNIEKGDLKKANKVIICGTSLRDFGYANNLDKFSWLKGFRKPVLGICGGMQIIIRVFEGEVKEIKSIGQEKIMFSKEFLGLNGEIEVYSLHNIGIRVIPEGFDVISKTDENIQAIKKDNLYGVLFHPEVRNKELIRKFLEI